MKIFCIGRNYVAHAKELGNEVPKRPMVFMKPPTALLRENKAFFYPEFSKDVHYEGEIVLKIAKNGKYIQKKNAHEHYDEIAYGIDFTARDLQSDLKSKGHPWEIAKAFDHSAAISPFVPLDRSVPVHIVTKVNGEIRQDATSELMIFSFDELIVYISQYFTLQQGDLIYTGTPAGVGGVSIGDTIEGFLNGKQLLSCDIR